MSMICFDQITPHCSRLIHRTCTLDQPFFAKTSAINFPTFSKSSQWFVRHLKTRKKKNKKKETTSNKLKKIILYNLVFKKPTKNSQVVL